jgi:transposase
MKRFIEGTDRGQSTLFPECLEDWIEENNPVQVIDVFVDELDLAELGFDGVAPELTGRPSYHPSVLLKLYIYGYLNRVQSSRRLEREAGRNVEVMWLTGRLVPDHKTIADFRKDNGQAIRKVCARFIMLCRALGLFGEVSVAIDGSKVQGGEQPGQELYPGEDGTTHGADRGERCPLSTPTRQRRSAGAVGGTHDQDDLLEREDREPAPRARATIVGSYGEPVKVLMPRVTIVDADKISDEAAAAVAEVSQTVNGALRVKLHDKHAALVSIGRYLGMFDDKVKVDAVYGISDEPMSAEEWKKQYVKEG